MNASRIGWAGALAFMSAGALACGYCVEDRVAAVYDHAVVERAKSQRHEVAFLALENTAARSAADAAAMRKAVEGIAGVDRGSVRVDMAQGALSVAFDPRTVPAGRMVEQVERAVGAPVMLLRLGAPGR